MKLLRKEGYMAGTPSCGVLGPERHGLLAGKRGPYFIRWLEASPVSKTMQTQI